MAKGPLLWLPRGGLTLVKETLRHVLRRPVIGVAAASRTETGQWLLIRRADTNAWALPGGTLEWGETLRASLEREVLEEAGADLAGEPRLLGVYSRPDRDPRFHAVTVLVSCAVHPPHQPPDNPLEIREARLFQEHELPPSLSHAQTDMLEHARRGGEAVFE